MTQRAWKRGLPPGKYYPGMEDDFEVAFAPLAKWHRRRTPEERAEYVARKARQADGETVPQTNLQKMQNAPDPKEG